VYSANNFENTDAQFKVNGSSRAEGVRFFNTNVTVNLTQHIVQSDGKEELQDPGLVKSETTVEFQDAELTDPINLMVEGDGLDMTIEANFAGSVEKGLVSLAFPSDQAEDASWWHIPDSITDLLPLPANFEERVEV
jgi:hypothetical protein